MCVDKSPSTSVYQTWFLFNTPPPPTPPEKKMPPPFPRARRRDSQLLSRPSLHLLHARRTAGAQKLPRQGAHQAHHTARPPRPEAFNEKDKVGEKLVLCDGLVVLGVVRNTSCVMGCSCLIEMEGSVRSDVAVILVCRKCRRCDRLELESVVPVVALHAAWCRSILDMPTPSKPKDASP